MIPSILGTIVFGAVIGVLARLVMRGRQNISMLWTNVCGVIGALFGYIVTIPFPAIHETNGIDVIRWLISIACAAVAITIYGKVKSGKVKSGK